MNTKKIIPEPNSTASGTNQVTQPDTLKPLINALGLDAAKPMYIRISFAKPREF